MLHGKWRGLDVAVKTVGGKSRVQVVQVENVEDSWAPSQMLFSDSDSSAGALPHERAVTEAVVATSVSHRNVVQTYHYGEASSQHI